MKKNIHPAVVRAFEALWSLQEAAADLNADTTINRKRDAAADDVRAILDVYSGIIGEIEGSLRMHVLHADVAALKDRWAASRNSRVLPTSKPQHPRGRHD